MLEFFNFGNSLKRWIGIFYTNIETVALNNGFETKWLKPSQGVRQGSPLSSHLFILGAEILASKIRQNIIVKGISQFGNEVKISQFADDTNLFCADITSAENALIIISNFGCLSGLQLNVKKQRQCG